MRWLPPSSSDGQRIQHRPEPHSGYRCKAKSFSTSKEQLRKFQPGLHPSQHDLLLHLVGRQVHPRDLQKGNVSNSVKQIITLIEARMYLGGLSISRCTQVSLKQKKVTERQLKKRDARYLHIFSCCMWLMCVQNAKFNQPHTLSRPPAEELPPRKAHRIDD